MVEVHKRHIQVPSYDDSYDVENDENRHGSKNKFRPRLFQMRDTYN